MIEIIFVSGKLTHQALSVRLGATVLGYSGDGGPATAAEIDSAVGQMDIYGNFYIGDNDNNRVRIVNTSGVIHTFAGTGIAGYSGDNGQATAAELYEPSFLMFDLSG